MLIDLSRSDRELLAMRPCVAPVDTLLTWLQAQQRGLTLLLSSSDSDLHSNKLLQNYMTGLVSFCVHSLHATALKTSA